MFVVKYTGRGLVVKRPGVVSKVQMLTLVLGVGVFSPSSKSGLSEAARFFASPDAKESPAASDF